MYIGNTFSPLGWIHLVLNRGLRRLVTGDLSPFWATGARSVDVRGGVGFIGDLSLVAICPARHERGILYIYWGGRSALAITKKKKRSLMTILCYTHVI